MSHRRAGAVFTHVSALHILFFIERLYQTCDTLLSYKNGVYFNFKYLSSDLIYRYVYIPHGDVNKMNLALSNISTKSVTFNMKLTVLI